MTKKNIKITITATSASSAFFSVIIAKQGEPNLAYHKASEFRKQIKDATNDNVFKVKMVAECGKSSKWTQEKKMEIRGGNTDWESFRINLGIVMSENWHSDFRNLGKPYQSGPYLSGLN